MVKFNYNAYRITVYKRNNIKHEIYIYMYMYILYVDDANFSWFIVKK